MKNHDPENPENSENPSKSRDHKNAVVDVPENPRFREMANIIFMDSWTARYDIFVGIDC